MMKGGKVVSNYLKWSEHSYPGEQYPPSNPVTPQAGSWPMFFIYRKNGYFYNPFGQEMRWKIKNPLEIDWDRELSIVRHTLQTLTQEQLRIAQFWGTGEVTKQITLLLFNLIESYGMGSARVARFLAFYHAAVNDAFVMTWYFKYFWDVARPCQFDTSLKPVLFTPRFPGYPSAHAALAGCTEIILSFFFPQESNRIHQIMMECADSRLYAGVHFKADNDEGFALGKQIGEIVKEVLKWQNI
jgi:hypothetical protein